MSRIDLRPKHLIILDAGHGIETPGKRSPVWADGRQLLEWAFNRDLARRIQQGLNDLGYDARLLVPEDTDLPLKARLKRARDMVEEHKGHGGIAPNRVLVSVHSNASTGKPTPKEPTPNPSLKGGELNPAANLADNTAAANTAGGGLPLFQEGAGGEALRTGGSPLTEEEEEFFRVTPSGWECFMQPSSYNSRELAGLLCRKALEQLPEQFPIRTPRGNLRNIIHNNTSRRWEGPSTWGKTQKLFITDNAPCTAVLTENLFMDNKRDCGYLLSDDGRDTLAQIHIDALDEFLAHNND